MEKNKNSFLGGKKLTIFDLVDLAGELEGYQLNGGNEESKEAERIYTELTELWFKSRIDGRKECDPELKKQYEIDQLYIKNTLMILKMKFKRIWK